MNRISCAAALLWATAALAADAPPKPPSEKPVELAPGVWHQQFHDIGTLGSNKSWIIFDDFVVVIDTGFPKGAEEALANIRQTTDKPIRFALDTHYHADHSFGNGVFAKAGATIIAHENARAHYVERNIENYNKTADKDPLYKKYPAVAPQVTFTKMMAIDDGKRRVEFHYFGQAHTTGCVWTWLFKEKILFTGDACVNGPFNYIGDGNVSTWIHCLDQAASLGAEIVGPGHGKYGKASELIANQKRYFVELRKQVGDLVKQGKSLEEVKAAVDIPFWKQWTGEKEYHSMFKMGIEVSFAEHTRGVWEQTPQGKPLKTPEKLKFLIGPTSGPELETLRRTAPNVEFVIAKDKTEALAAAADVDGAVATLASADFLKAAKKLRWLHSPSAGVETYLAMPEIALNDKLTLTNGKTLYSPEIADHVFGMLLSFTRDLRRFDALQRDAKWSSNEDHLKLYELKGKTLLIVGLGGIGTEVAKRGHGFGMEVVAVDILDKGRPVFVDRLEKPDALARLLPLADAVVLCCPLTDQTRGMIGAKELALMKPTAYLINIARGKLVRTDALVAALSDKKIAGAGLDVTEPEPLPADHPLWKLPNVILTPHVAGLSPESRERIPALLRENLRRFARGEALLNTVDKKLQF